MADQPLRPPIRTFPGTWVNYHASRAASVLCLCLVTLWAKRLSRFLLSLGVFFGSRRELLEALAFSTTSWQSETSLEESCEQGLSPFSSPRTLQDLRSFCCSAPSLPSLTLHHSLIASDTPIWLSNSRCCPCCYYQSEQP